VYCAKPEGQNRQLHLGVLDGGRGFALSRVRGPAFYFIFFFTGVTVLFILFSWLGATSTAREELEILIIFGECV